MNCRLLALCRGGATRSIIHTSRPLARPWLVSPPWHAMAAAPSPLVAVTTSTTSRLFASPSAAAAAAEEEPPIIPGIGKGKTSTGIVSM